MTNARRTNDQTGSVERQISQETGRLLYEIERQKDRQRGILKLFMDRRAPVSVCRIGPYFNDRPVVKTYPLKLARVPDGGAVQFDGRRYTRHIVRRRGQRAAWLLFEEYLRKGFLVTVPDGVYVTDSHDDAAGLFFEFTVLCDTKLHKDESVRLSITRL